MSSSLGGIIDRAILSMSGAANEFAITLTNEQREFITRALFQAYNDSFGDGHEVLFDTNRLWSTKLPLISRLFPAAKVIGCVRDPAWVMDSFEQLVRGNMLEASLLFSNDHERSTVFSRTEALTKPTRLIGYSVQAMQEAYFSKEADRLLLVEYDTLASRPKETLQLIYDFIGEPWFEHNFENVEFRADEFDNRLGTPRLHTVRKKVEFKRRRSVLPPDLFQRLSQMVFWRDLKGTRAKAIVAQPEQQTDTHLAAPVNG